MRLFTKIHIFYFLSFFFCLFSSGEAQPSFGGEYMLVQYIQEESGHRSVMHFQLIADGDTSGTYKELFRQQGEPDSGSFNYYVEEDRTFIIPEEDGIIHGISDEQGDVFSIVRADSNYGFALYAVGVRNSAGRTVSDLSGEYWASEFFAEPGFQAVGFDYVDFDGSGNATLYRIDNSVGELDSTEFTYTVDDDGTIIFDDFLIGKLSPDGQFLVAAGQEPEGFSSTYVLGIKKSSELNNNILDGRYIYNESLTEDESVDEESAVYVSLDFDGEGTAEVTAFLGEPYHETFDYEIQSDGAFEIDTSLGAVSGDGQYFFLVDFVDTLNSSVAFGLGIKAGDLSTAVEKNFTDLTPSAFTLEQNFPNPFNPRTIINYKLPITNEVELNIYNLLGQKVAVLVSERQSAGSYQVEWDASDFASGIYYYQLITDAGLVQTRKLVLVK